MQHLDQRIFAASSSSSIARQVPGAAASFVQFGEHRRIWNLSAFAHQALVPRAWDLLASLGRVPGAIPGHFAVGFWIEDEDHVCARSRCWRCSSSTRGSRSSGCGWSGSWRCFGGASSGLDLGFGESSKVGDVHAVTLQGLDGEAADRPLRRLGPVP